MLEQRHASRMTVSEALDTAADKQKWAAAFGGYKAAWNGSWQFLERHGCLRVPAIYKVRDCAFQFC